jgi:AcrR family transcriptional regulator
MPDADECGRSEHTRDRLLAAGLRLFAERGFSAVSVGEIERSVGLVPQCGALYRHFASKEELLEAAFRGYLESLTAGRVQFVGSATSDVRADALDLARWVLHELDDQRDITRVLEREGDPLPTLCDTFRTHVSDSGYAGMAEILRRWLQKAGLTHHSPTPTRSRCTCSAPSSTRAAPRGPWGGRCPAWTTSASPGPGPICASACSTWTRQRRK